MSEQPNHILRIYLHELAEKDAAIITRVVNFSSSQGKPYVLHPNPAESHILIVAGDTPVQTQNPIPIIRIHHQVIAPQELLLAPPLLVTRVMRVLDEAVNQLRAAQTPSATEAQTAHALQLSAPNTTLPEPILPTPEPTGQTLLALIIDDSLAIRTQLAIELRNMNIACEQAEDGERGLALLEQKSYHMIFLDIIMPGIDGYEVCKQIRQRAATRKTPIIMLSGKDTPLDEVKGIIAGATTYLTKPVNPERLQQTIGRMTRWLR
ncbi:response regulator [Thiofilum flexile]|uniref:response regulator n=1 Tax=Thiofilum flexile TaxID=125627 RepID=UPI00036A81F2|nr:response regulator [Thiofilum flexile]